MEQKIDMDVARLECHKGLLWCQVDYLAYLGKAEYVTVLQNIL